MMTMTVNDWLTALAAAACAFALAAAAIAAIVLGRKVKAARTLAAELRELGARLEQIVAGAMALHLLRPRIGAELAPWQTYPECPDCGSSFLDEGPRGGASINLICRDCGTRWNAVPPMRLIQRI
jgi:hypothetical protein